MVGWSLEFVLYFFYSGYNESKVQRFLWTLECVFLHAHSVLDWADKLAAASG